jgi:hypothetical protein
MLPVSTGGGKKTARGSLSLHLTNTCLPASPITALRPQPVFNAGVLAQTAAPTPKIRAGPYPIMLLHNSLENSMHPLYRYLLLYESGLSGAITTVYLLSQQIQVQVAQQKSMA